MKKKTIRELYCFHSEQTSSNTLTRDRVLPSTRIVVTTIRTIVFPFFARGNVRFTTVFSFPKRFSDNTRESHPDDSIPAHGPNRHLSVYFSTGIPIRKYFVKLKSNLVYFVIKIRVFLYKTCEDLNFLYPLFDSKMVD